jgi:hypothetical protein
MSRKQRQLLFTLAAFTLVIGLQSLAAAGETIQTLKPASAQQQSAERWKVLQDQQTNTQKSASPKLYQNMAKGAHIPTVTLETKTAPTGGSTGPIAPPKPTQGNIHR